MASEHEPCASCADTLHTCSSQKRFPITVFEKTVMSRGCMQSITFAVHMCAVRYSFIKSVENITKLQREAQSILLIAECVVSVSVYQFSKDAHRIYQKTAGFWSQGRRGLIQSRKHVVWSTHVSDRHRLIWHKNAPNASGAGEHSINISKCTI